MTNPAYTEIPDEGIDATHLVGAESDGTADALFLAFQATHKAASERPCVNTFRACVEAYDAFYACLSGTPE